MKREIRQNGKTVLYGEDGHSIPMIFNNLVGKNLKGREYSDYIAFVAIPDMGFTYGKIAYYSDGNLIATGEITPYKSGKTKCARFEKRNVQKSGKTKRSKNFAHTTL